MLLVVLETLLGASVHALLTVEQVGGVVPDIAQVIDAELVGGILVLYEDVTLVRRFAQLHVAHTGIFENLLHLILVLVTHLDDNTGVLGKENLHEVVLLDFVQADVQAAFGVGKAHLQQGRDETSGRDVVAGKYQAFLHQLLDGEEGIAEVFGVLYGGHIVAYLIE